MSANRPALLAIVIAIGVGLCGCTAGPSTVVPSGPATTSYPGAPAPLPSGLVAPSAGYATVVDGRLAIVLSGSSSCPPHADSADLATMTFGFSTALA